jgi:hypothetical protein
MFQMATPENRPSVFKQVRWEIAAGEMTEERLQERQSEFVAPGITVRQYIEDATAFREFTKRDGKILFTDLLDDPKGKTD